jgi:hypothetical protein
MGRDRSASLTLLTHREPASIIARDKGGSLMIYELRVYRCVPGKLQALVTRFEKVTCALFEKHGIKQAGYWTTVVGDSNNDFYYMLKWDSLDERGKRFAAFQADPDWISARNKSEEGGPLVANITNTILMPTSYSAQK